MSEQALSQSFLEETIKREFKARGSPIRPFSNTGDLFEKWALYTRVPFVSPYGHKGHTEFLFRHWRGHDIRIECKCQATAGSVDEKFPYMLLCAKDCYPEPEIWFVLECEGARTLALKWFATQCAKIATKTVRVMNMHETRAAIKGLMRQLDQ